MEYQKIGRELILLIIRGREVAELNVYFLKEIARCYMIVFNNSWDEEWTEESAMAEIKKSFVNEPGREFIGTILLYKNKVVGFSWGVIADFVAISPAKDFPFSSPVEENERAMKSLFRFLEISENENKKALIFREIGVLKAFRGRKASYLAFHLMKFSLESKAKNIFLWTTPKSPAFRLSLGLFWRPIFFFENGCFVMGGNSIYSHGLIKKGLSYNPLVIWQGYKELKFNKDHFFGNL